ncbi:MAG: phosphoenolpyruvate--protein phosphotransferase [Planctomycetales bacterium]|nr:phosphoenolpyruvate--protein phosphotransferase [Planctomycetales bacterium]
MILQGKTITPGIARGVTHVVDARAILATAMSVPPGESPQSELERLHAAIGRACVQLDRLQRQLMGRVAATDVAIFESHAGLLRDSQFVSRIENEIHAQSVSAEAAVSRVVTDLHATFLVNKVSLVRDKAADILDIGRRLLQCLNAAPLHDVELGPDSVVVAASLTPSELVHFAHQGVVAIVTETCGLKSHTAILARGFSIPMVTGVATACETIANQAEVIVDATGGRIIIGPDDATKQTFDVLVKKKQADEPEDSGPLPPPVTHDGVTLRLLLNISDRIEAAAVPQLGANGVGLFRTEFLYMDRPWWPTEDESYVALREVSDAMGDPATDLNVRLVDFGAEKCPAYSDIPVNRNPSLGLRGIRLLLQREDIFKPQVRAIARLARERKLTLLIPMLDTLDTLDATIEKLCQFVGVPQREQLPFKIGTMIEVPSAAILIDDLLPRVDAVAVGLNDLTQYLLAADRDDELVERYHDPLQPVVLRLLKRIVEAAETHCKPLTICGELAGDPKLTGLLLALGIRRLSVSRSSYAAVLSAIHRLSLRSIDGAADEILSLSTGAAVRRFIAEHMGS